MDLIYDHLDDPQHLVFAVIAKEYDIPDFVKSASSEEDRSNKKLFAWEHKSRFPMDTAHDLALSHLYFEKTAKNIPLNEHSFIRENLDRVALLMGVDLPSRLQKAASVEYDIKLEDFAVSIPMSSFSLREKYAKHEYNDHFVLYPLDNQESVKTANIRFPRGLDDELEYFRPQVAQAIASHLPESSLSYEVKQYLPIPKSATIEQLDYRIGMNTSKTASYEALKRDLSDPNMTAILFSYALEKLDNSVGMAQLTKGANLLEGKRYIAGIYNDMNNPDNITILGRELPFNTLVKSASRLIDIYPNIEQWMQTPAAAQTCIDNFSQSEKELLLRTVLT